MWKLDSPLKFSLAVYLFVAFFLLYAKPLEVFDGNRLRRFGTEQGETLTPFWLVSFAGGLAGYYAATEIF